MHRTELQQESLAAIGSKLAELAESALWHRSPFDVFQYVSMADMYMPYINEYPKEEQARLIKSMVILARTRANKSLPKNIDAYTALVPIRQKLKEKFLLNWKPITSDMDHSEMTFGELKKLVIKVMKLRMPQYEYEILPDGLHDPAILTFTKPFLTDSKWMIRFDRGTHTPDHLSPSLGITDPWYEVDVDAFLGNSRWGFASIGECQITINKIMDVVEKLSPIFETAVHRALNK